MRNIAYQIADRMLDLVAPRAEAKASDCYWTVIYCYCKWSTLYFYYCCYPGAGCYCKAKQMAPGGCA